MSNGGPEIAPRHRRALDVPSRTPRTPGRSPGRRLGLPRLSPLPECEVARVALAARGRVRGVGQVVDPLVGELAVVGPTAHIEIHIAGFVVRHVGVTTSDQPGDDLLHLRNRGRCARLVGRRKNAQRPVGGREFEFHPVRERPPLFTVRGVLEHLVVDVGDVPHEGHGQAAVGEPASPQVIGER